MSRAAILGAAAILALASVLLAAHHTAATALAVAALAGVCLASWDVETALGVLLVYLPIRTLAAAMVPLPLRFVADAVVLVLLVRLLLLHRRDVLPLGWIEWGAVAFAAASLALTAHAGARFPGAILELRDLLLFPILYAVVRRLHALGDGPGPDWWERFLPIGLAAIAVVGAQGLLEVLVVHHPYLTPQALAVAQGHVRTNAGRPYGWLDNPNVYGQLGLIALALTYYHFRAHRFRPAVPFAALSVLFAAMVVVSLSRSAYLILVVGTVVFMCASNSGRERVAMALATAAILLAVLASPMGRARTLGALSAPPPPPIARVHGGRSAGEGSGRTKRPGGIASGYVSSSRRAGRIRTLVVAARLIRRFPLGTGLGTFGNAGSKVFGNTLRATGLPRTFFADDNYAVILVETGIPGAILFLFLGAGLYVTLWRLKRRLAPFDRALLWLLFLALMILGFTGNAWEQLNLTLYPWLALGILYRSEPVGGKRASGGARA